MRVYGCACVCILRFPVDNPAEPAALPPVTVLKPLHDIRAGSPGAVSRRSAGRTMALRFRFYVGRKIRTLPPLRSFGRWSAHAEGTAIELVVDPRSHGVNRKVSNLINMMPRARYDTLVLSDSDIVVGPSYLRAVVALLALPRVGAVTCLYHGIGGEGLWTRLSALAVNSQFLPQAITAISLDLARPCCGATIALRRPMLDRIGGFGALANVLADDHAIGVAVRAEGYDVVAAPFLVGHQLLRGKPASVAAASDPGRPHDQEHRSDRLRRYDHNPSAGRSPFLPMMLGSPAAAVVVVAALLTRAMLCLCVEWRFDLPRQDYWLIPLQDVIAFAIYVTSFFGATVHWQRRRLSRDGGGHSDRRPRLKQA